MATSNQINPGMMISIAGKLYRVESAVKVTVPRGTPFIKTKLQDINTNKVIEKNFKVNQPVETVVLKERKLEFLYPEGKDYIFLDTGNLEQVTVSGKALSSNVNYLKEGIEVLGSFYGDSIFTIEMPQFLELMVAETEANEQEDINLGTAAKMAVLETGAKVEVPPFIEIGDIIKVDTKTNEYVQRV